MAQPTFQPLDSIVRAFHWPLWNRYVQAWAAPVAQFNRLWAGLAQGPLAPLQKGVAVKAEASPQADAPEVVFSSANWPLAAWWHAAGFPRFEARFEPASADLPLARLTLAGQVEEAVAPRVVAVPAASAVPATPKAAKPASAGPVQTKPAKAAKAVKAAAVPRQYTAAPAEVDDLRFIYGVGPALAKLLNAQGIYQFRQVAAWSTKDVADFDSRLGRFKGRIERDQWIRSATEEHYKKYGVWLGKGKPAITLPETDR